MKPEERAALEFLLRVMVADPPDRETQDEAKQHLAALTDPPSDEGGAA